MASSESDDDFDLEGGTSSSKGLKLIASFGSRKWNSDDEGDDLDFDVSDQEGTCSRALPSPNTLAIPTRP
jgi:hypothetical protein